MWCLCVVGLSVLWACFFGDVCVCVCVGRVCVRFACVRVVCCFCGECGAGVCVWGLCVCLGVWVYVLWVFAECI